MRRDGGARGLFILIGQPVKNRAMIHKIGIDPLAHVGNLIKPGGDAQSFRNVEHDRIPAIFAEKTMQAIIGIPMRFGMITGDEM